MPPYKDKLNSKIEQNFPPKTKIPIVFYESDPESAFNLWIVNNVYKDVKKIDSAQKLVNLFDEYRYLNFIKVDDVVNAGGNEVNSISAIKEYISGLCESFNADIPLFDVYTISEDSYNEIVSSNGNAGFFAINASGRITLFEESVRESVSSKIKEFNYREARIIYKKPYFETLDKFINFFVRNNKILFVSRKEDYDENEIIYPKRIDVKEIDLFDDLKAICEYSKRSRKANLYMDNSLWAEHFLQKEADGLSVIDEEFYILYANEKRRQRHKNNLLGKKCHKVFCNLDSPCKGCFYESEACGFGNRKTGKQDSKEKFNRNTDFHELELTDKAGNNYFLTEYNRVVRVNCYQTYLGISACRDTNVRHEISELTRSLQKESISDMDELLGEIIKVFTTKIHFKNIRIYLNFNAYSPHLKDTKVDENNEDGPVLILAASSEDDQKKGDIKISTNSLRSYGFDTKNKKSVLDYFNETKNAKRLEVFEIGSMDPESSIGEKIYNILKDKWIGLPLWNGDHLVGAICLDMGQQSGKWDIINTGIMDQLIIGSEYLASTLENILTNIRLGKSKNIIHEITRISGSENIEKELLKYISNVEQNTFCEWYEIENSIENSEKYILSSCAFNGEDVEVKERIELSVSTDPITDGKELFRIYSNDDSKYDEIKVLLNSFGKEYREISILTIPVFSRNEKKPQNILRLITKVGDGDLPFSFHDKELYEDVIGKYFSKIYRTHYETTKLLQTIKETTRTITISDDIKKDIENIFAQLNTIFPEKYWYFYLKEDNKLLLKSSSENSDSCPVAQDDVYILFDKKSNPKEVYNTGKYSLTVDVFNIDFADNYRYFSSIRKRNDFLKRRIGEIPKSYEEEQIFIDESSELIVQIFFKDQKVGLLKMRELKNDAFDFELITFVLIFAEVIGNIVGLVSEIETKKQYQKSLIHALRSPIVRARNALDAYPKHTLNIKDINDFYKLDIKTSGYEKYPKYYLYALLHRLQSAISIANFYVENIDALDFEKFTIKESVDVRKILVDICFLTKYDAEVNKEGLRLDFTNLIEKGKKLHTIYGDPGKLKLAFYNLLDNAIKYSFKVNGKYRSVIIEEEYNAGLLIYRITNFGEPPDEKPDELFKINTRGTNAEKYFVDGTGEGLARCKQIIEYHGGRISMHCDYERKKTTLTVIINTSTNLLNLFQYVKKDSIN